MQFFGLSDADYEAEKDIGVWPDNWDAVLLFDSLSSQWRSGPSGVYGLDYNVLYRKMDRMGLSPDRYDELEDEIRILEQAALHEIHKE